MTLHVDRVEGRGHPIVLLHGILDSPRVWDSVAAKLEDAGRALLRVHARGHGRSPAWPTAAAPSTVEEADELARELAAWAPEGAHLVGHSRGATVMSWLAVEAPHLARTLAVVASPPQASEAFRAHFRAVEPKDARAEAALRYLAAIPDDEFPQHALRRYRGRALVVEAEDDPLYSPTHTLFWRMFLPYADFERVPGGHRFFADSEEAARWLAERLLRHVEASDA